MNYFSGVKNEVDKVNLDLISMCEKMGTHLGLNLDTSLFFRGQQFQMRRMNILGVS